jgi:hypothetical protein
MPSTDNTAAPRRPAVVDELAPTLEAIRTNCHISDARHASDYTLCVYLLKMREYYRWEKDLPFSATLPHDRLTHWLSEREAFWKTLERRPFRNIPVLTQSHDPFDARIINDVLNGSGYVYSGGIGHNMKPHFFLGVLEERRVDNGYTLYVSGKEFARDLAAPPAMSLGRTIFVRRENRGVALEQARERHAQGDQSL